MNSFITNNDGIVLKYVVGNDDFSIVGEVSSKIKNVLKQLNIDNKLIRRVSIATYEAEVNVAIHSLGGYIEVTITENEIKIKIRDNGPGIKDTKLAMEKGYSTASNKARELGFGAGMGLPNMKRCSDEFKIESKFGEYTELNMKFIK
ncbi:anti-sigma regulatory factor [Clostridiaceae bacterium HSG29]|nr:anti-sigma regulatory factor [Clostridiaceae bacterium HSG29]